MFHIERSKSDIRKWIASGELGGAYHDVATDELVLPGAERPSIVKKPPKKEDLRTENEKILDEIAQLNVDIKDGRSIQKN